MKGGTFDPKTRVFIDLLVGGVWPDRRSEPSFEAVRMREVLVCSCAQSSLQRMFEGGNDPHRYHPARVPIPGRVLPLAVAILLSSLRQSLRHGADGLLPQVFMNVHTRFGTPATGTLIVGVTAALIAGPLPIEVLGEVVVIVGLIVFINVCVNVLILRRTHLVAPRIFRVPGVPFVPCRACSPSAPEARTAHCGPAGLLQ